MSHLDGSFLWPNTSFVSLLTLFPNPDAPVHRGSIKLCLEDNGSLRRNRRSDIIGFSCAMHMIARSFTKLDYVQECLY